MVIDHTLNEYRSTELPIRINTMIMNKGKKTT